MAAEASGQTVRAFWVQMTDAERARWLDDARTRWPRAYRFLAPILRSAEAALANERGADGEGAT
jgi:hypothetical protein